jgi:hypothetical protein
MIDTNRIRFKMSFEYDTQVVTLETAEYLKEKGFDLPTQHYYQENDIGPIRRGLKQCTGIHTINLNDYDMYICSAPTPDEYEKWLVKYQAIPQPIKDKDDVYPSKDLRNEWSHMTLEEMYEIAKDMGAPLGEW